MRKIDTRSFVRATRSTSRDINRQIALNLVREHQPISRADLARRMHVGRGMVTSLVDELLAENAIYEGATVEAPRGRKPMMLYVRTHDRLAVAVDVRFSQTYVALTDFGGRVLAMESFETVVAPAALVAAIAARVAALLASRQAGTRCEGVGMVVPGMVDNRTGRVLFSPQLGWRDVDVRDALAEAVGLPVFIESAPIACALAQLWLRSGDSSQAPNDFAYVTIGDGVGAGIVVNGQVMRGYANTAGEFGHAPLSLDGPPCLCGRRGCVEAYTSNLATLSRYLGHEFAPDSVRDLLHASGITLPDLVERHRAGDARATAAFERTAEYLGMGLGLLVTILSPARIYIGGEITAAWEHIAPIVREAVARRALTAGAAATPIEPDLTNSYPRLRGGTALVAAPMFAAPRVA